MLLSTAPRLRIGNPARIAFLSSSRPSGSRVILLITKLKAGIIGIVAVFMRVTLYVRFTKTMNSVFALGLLRGDWKPSTPISTKLLEG